MYKLVLAAFLGFMVSRPEVSGKAFVAIDDLDYSRICSVTSEKKSIVSLSPGKLVLYSHLDPSLCAV